MDSNGNDLLSLREVGKEQYFELLSALRVPESFDYGFLYDTYQAILDGVGDIRLENPVIANMSLNP